MDDRRFDDLTKAIVGGFSRRRFIGRLAAIVAGALSATGALGPGA
jgi:hypothetical protein